MKYIKLTLLLIISLLYATSCMAESIDWDALVEAVISVESNGNPNAVSNAGCVGLMQINPRGALKEYNEIELHSAPHLYYNVGHLYIPSINVKIGTWYLKRLRDHYKCPSIECILAAYNGGITRLKRNNWDISKMPQETQNYVTKVMDLYETRHAR